MVRLANVCQLSLMLLSQYAANSSDAVIGSEEHEVIAVVDEEVTKPQEGRKLKVTRRATAYKDT